MEIVIKIHEKDYQSMKNGHIPFSVLNAIMNGTLLPKGHGDLIDKDELLDSSYQIDSMIYMYDEVVNADDIKSATVIIEADGGE